jgi:hypothetical protein
MHQLHIPPAKRNPRAVNLSIVRSKPAPERAWFAVEWKAGRLPLNRTTANASTIFNVCPT